jgi:hypothetical protein
MKVVPPAGDLGMEIGDAVKYGHEVSGCAMQIYVADPKRSVNFGLHAWLSMIWRGGMP